MSTIAWHELHKHNKTMSGLTKMNTTYFT